MWLIAIREESLVTYECIKKKIRFAPLLSGEAALPAETHMR